MNLRQRQSGAILAEMLFAAVLFMSIVAFYGRTVGKNAQDSRDVSPEAGHMMRVGTQMQHETDWYQFDVQQIALNAVSSGVSFDTCARNPSCANRYNNLTPGQAKTLYGGYAWPGGYNVKNSLALDETTMHENFDTAGTGVVPVPAGDGFVVPEYDASTCDTTTSTYADRAQAGSIPVTSAVAQQCPPDAFWAIEYVGPAGGTLPLSDYNLYWASMYDQWSITNFKQIAASMIGYFYPATSATNRQPAATKSGAVIAMGGGWQKAPYFLVPSKAFPNELPGTWSVADTTAGKAQMAQAGRSSLPVGSFVPAIIRMLQPISGLVVSQTTTSTAGGYCEYGGNPTTVTTTQLRTVTTPAPGATPTNPMVDVHLASTVVNQYVSGCNPPPPPATGQQSAPPASLSNGITSTTCGAPSYGGTMTCTITIGAGAGAQTFPVSVSCSTTGVCEGNYSIGGGAITGTISVDAANGIAQYSAYSALTGQEAQTTYSPSGWAGQNTKQITTNSGLPVGDNVGDVINNMGQCSTDTTGTCAQSLANTTAAQLTADGYSPATIQSLLNNALNSTGTPNASSISQKATTKAAQTVQTGCKNAGQC